MIDPVQRAVWFVESHSRDSLTLEGIARECKVSSFHLTRAFASTLGLPLMRYVRGRRLSEAARRLASGADDILQVALDAGYGSHEAFTRAFRDQFQQTPQQVRTQGHVDNLLLVEMIPMNSVPASQLLPPRFETSQSMVIAGLQQRYACQSPQGIPDQWQRFQRYLGTIAGRVGGAAYGVCTNFDSDGNFDYVCGVQVNGSGDLPRELVAVNVPRQLYVVFTHPGHVAGIRTTFAAIWSSWFTNSGYEPVEAPTLEYYGPEFNPMTGLGGLEIWIAVKPATE